jgi:hypothetical protein
MSMTALGAGPDALMRASVRGSEPGRILADPRLLDYMTPHDVAI